MDNATLNDNDGIDGEEIIFPQSHNNHHLIKDQTDPHAKRAQNSGNMLNQDSQQTDPNLFAGFMQKVTIFIIEIIFMIGCVEYDEWWSTL